jgi:hypothetical protein
MILDGSCEPHRAKIELVLELVSAMFLGRGDLPGMIKVSPDIKKDIYFLSPKGNRAYYDLHGVQEFSGFLVPPLTDDLRFTILIAERQFADFQYARTLAHELAHLQDYFRYYSENGNLGIKSPEEQARRYYREFYYWSEFHARRAGISFGSIYSWHFEYNLDLPPDGNYSMTIDLQTKGLEDALDRFLSNRASESANDLFWGVVAALVCYYARLSLNNAIGLDSIPDLTFPREKLAGAFGVPILALFPLLKSMRTYEEAVSSLPSLKSLFDRITAKLNADYPWSFLRSTYLDQLSAVQDEMRKAVESVGRTTSIADAFKSYADVFQSLGRRESSPQVGDKNKAKG